MRLHIDRRGGVGVFVALVLPLLLASAAFAVDLGAVELDTRRLQGVADAAALAAAARLDAAQAAADASVSTARWPRPVVARVTLGRYTRDETLPANARFAAGAADPDAVRVTVETASPTFFAKVFGSDTITISRQATAARQRLAAFALGSRLASLDGGVANAMLSTFAGSSVALNLLDYRAMASADVDLFPYLDALRTQARLDAGTYRDLLSAQVSAADALQALALRLDADRQGTAAAAVRTLAGAATTRRLSLAQLIDAGPLGQQAGGGAGLVKVDALSLATALLQTASPDRQFSADFAGAVPGLASVRATIAIGERMQQSPWVTITARGVPVVRTAQARILLETKLTPAPLPGIATPVSIRTPLFVELASAEARLAAVDCGADSAVTLEARPSPGRAAIADVDTSRLADFSTALALPPARLIDLALVTVDGGAALDLGAAEPWQRLRFARAEIDSGMVKSVASNRPIAGLGASLAQRLTLTTRVLGLGLTADPLARAVGSGITAAAPALDTSLGLATGALGVKIGEADAKVTGLRCGGVALVG